MNDFHKYKFLPAERADRCRLVFPDGVEYTLREAVLVANGGDDSELDKIHSVKKAFDGVIESVMLRHPQKYPEVISLDWR